MRYIGLILAGLLALCLTNMPYGYYELIRYLTTVFFAWMALQSYKDGNDNLTLVYVAVAILFQPFLKITLSKEIWNVVDVLTAGWLVYLYVKNMKLTKKS